MSILASFAAPKSINRVEGMKQEDQCRYTLTKGAQFGADYLIYQGSPEMYHAAACLRIIHSEVPPDPLLLAGFCRCANAARKDVILACWDEQSHTPHFMTIRQRPEGS